MSAPPPTPLPTGLLAPAPEIPPSSRLVVRLPNPIGDVAMSTPALRGLRRALPGTKIVWAGSPAALAVLAGMTDRDETFEISGPYTAGLFGPRRLGAAWRKAGADAVLLLPNSRSSAAAAWASRAAVRAGTPLSGRKGMLTHVVHVPMDGRRIAPGPMTLHYLRLAAPFGATDDGMGVRLEVTPDGEAAARARLQAAGIDGRYFVVSPGAAFGPSKIYPPHLLAEAVAILRMATGLVPLVLCGPGEEALAAEVAHRAGPPVASTHAAYARWPEAKSLLKRAALLMSPDAGPRHVATGVGTPAVIWMGPTDPRWSAGDERLVTVLRREELTCLACHLRTCPIGHPCMLGLSPRAVAEACVAQLSRTGGRTTRP